MEKEGRIMYLGKWINSDNSLRYKYIEINADNSLGREWNFKRNIFFKGTIGSVYSCSFERDSIIYRKSTIPTSILLERGKGVSTFILFPQLRRYQEESRQAEVVIRNSKRPTTPLDEEVKNMKETYRSLPISKRAAFVRSLILN